MAFNISSPLLNSPRISESARFSSETAVWPGVEFIVSEEDISSPTEWTVNDKRHIAIVHLGGNIAEMETELERCGRVLDPPMDGELWLIPSGSKYASRVRGGKVRYAEFCMEPEYIKELTGSRAENYTPEPRIGAFDEFFYRSVLYLAGLMNKTDDISVMIRQTLSQTLCLHLYKKYDGSENDIARQHKHTRFTAQEIKMLNEYFEEHLDSQISLEDLSSLTGATPHYFLQAFRKAFGSTPAQYLILQRLRRVRHLLSKTTKDITTIAFETGFSSHSHLTTTFKKHYDFTPNQFRLSRPAI